MSSTGDDQRTGRPAGARAEREEKPYEQDPLYQHLTRERRRNYRLSRREIINASERRRRASDPDRRDKERARRYGLALEELRAMLARQGHACAICRRSDRPLSIDHCHVTEMVRRLLCRSCNTGLGCFDDDPKLLRAAAAYLEAARREQRRALRRGVAHRLGAIGAWPESFTSAACRAVGACMKASKLSGVLSAVADRVGWAKSPAEAATTRTTAAGDPRSEPGTGFAHAGGTRGHCARARCAEERVVHAQCPPYAST